MASFMQSFNGISEKIGVGMTMSRRNTDPPMQILTALAGGAVAIIVGEYYIFTRVGLPYMVLPFIVCFAYYQIVFLATPPADTEKYLTFKVSLVRRWALLSVAPVPAVLALVLVLVLVLALAQALALTRGTAAGGGGSGGGGGGGGGEAAAAAGASCVRLHWLRLPSLPPQSPLLLCMRASVLRLSVQHRRLCIHDGCRNHACCPTPAPSALRRLLPRPRRIML